MRNIPEARRKPEDQTPKSSTGNSLESRLEILENQMVKVLMETKRAETVNRQSGNQQRPYSSVIRGDRQPDVKQQIIPGVMHPGPVTRAVHGDTISAVTTVPRDGMNDNIQTVYGPTNNWQTVGKHRTWTRPKPVFGRKKSDDNLSALPRRYTVVVFNVSSKEEDKVKNYMVSNDVHVVDIKRLSTDDRYVHSFKVVIYRKQAEKVMEDDFWPEDVGCRPFVFQRKTINHTNG